MDQITCPNCHLPVLNEFFFCPNCGKNLRPKPLSVNAGKLIGFYFLSLFLPPLGIWPGFKYLFQDDNKAKKAGLIMILLTILSLALTFYFARSLIGQITKEFNSQMQSTQLTP